MLPTTPARNRVVPARAMFLAAAFLSFLLSVYLFFVEGDERGGIFVAVWVPSILSLGSLLHVGEAAR